MQTNSLGAHGVRCMQVVRGRAPQLLTAFWSLVEREQGSAVSEPVELFLAVLGACRTPATEGDGEQQQQQGLAGIGTGARGGGTGRVPHLGAVPWDA
jgi:hypothetical protein